MLVLVLGHYFPSSGLHATSIVCLNLEFIHVLFEIFYRYDAGKLQGMGPL
jgi:hypothetical protein